MDKVVGVIVCREDVFLCVLVCVEQSFKVFHAFQSHDCFFSQKKLIMSALQSRNLILAAITGTTLSPLWLLNDPVVHQEGELS